MKVKVRTSKRHSKNHHRINTNIENTYSEYEPDDRPCCSEHKGCRVVTYQNAKVSVPITVKPRVAAGEINTFCCGEPIVKKSPCTLRYQGDDCYPDLKPKSQCSFVLSQNICVEIPIEFFADTIICDPRITCNEVIT